jgi:hypothetical protein
MTAWLSSALVSAVFVRSATASAAAAGVLRCRGDFAVVAGSFMTMEDRVLRTAGMGMSNASAAAAQSKRKPTRQDMGALRPFTPSQV